MATKAPEDTAREELKRLIARYGIDLADNASRVGALLRDVCGQHRKEISLLVGAVEEGITSELRRGGVGSVTASRLASLAKRLERSRGLSQENARWAVEAWAAALKGQAVVVQDVSSSPPSIDEGTASGATVPDVLPRPPEPADRGMPESPAAGVETAMHPSFPPPGVVDQPPPTLGADAVGPAPMPSGQLDDPEIPEAGALEPARRGTRRRLLVGLVTGLIVVGGSVVALPNLVSGERSRDEDPRPPGTSTTSPTSSPSPQDEPAVGPPRQIHVTKKTHDAIYLAWRPPAGPQEVRYFLVLRDGHQVGRTHQRTFVDDEIQAGERYRYRIIAVGTDGSRARSEWLPVTAPQEPAPVQPVQPTQTPAPAPSTTPAPPPPEDNVIDTKAECEEAGGTWLPGDGECLF